MSLKILAQGFACILLISIAACSGSSGTNEVESGKHRINNVVIDLGKAFKRIQNKSDYDQLMPATNIFKDFFWKQMSRKISPYNAVFLKVDSEDQFVLVDVKTKGRRLEINEESYLEMKERFDADVNEQLRELESKVVRNNEPRFIKFTHELKLDDVSTFNSTYVVTNEVRTAGVNVQSFGSREDLEDVISQIKMY